MDITNGNGHESPLFKCDFCSSPKIVWSYDCVSYEVVTVLEDQQGRMHVFPWHSDNGWAACNICSELVEQERWTDLANRALETLPGMDKLNDMLKEDELLNAIKAFHRLFVQFHRPRQSIKFG